MLEWESAGGRSTNNSRVKLRRCTCSPRRLAGRGLRCKGGLRRARDKGSRDSIKDGQATDAAEWEEIHMELEERAGLTDGSESFDIERAPYLGRRGGTSIQPRRMPFGEENRFQTRDAEAYRRRRSRRRERANRARLSLPCGMSHFQTFSVDIGTTLQNLAHYTEAAANEAGIWVLGIGKLSLQGVCPGKRGLGSLPHSFAGWTCWLFDQGSSILFFVQILVPLREVGSNAWFLHLRFFDTLLLKSQPGNLWWRTCWLESNHYRSSFRLLCSVLQICFLAATCD